MNLFKAFNSVFINFRFIPRCFQCLHDTPGLLLALLPLLKYMSMCRYKWTCRSCHTPQCRHDELRGPCRQVMLLLRSSVDTIVPGNLNRYDRKHAVTSSSPLHLLKNLKMITNFYEQVMIPNLP